MSHPCCMKAPIANQRLLKMVKLLEMDGPSMLSSICHSNGLNRLTRNRTTLTPRYEKTIHIQISDDRGFMNENTLGSSFIGFCSTTNDHQQASNSNHSFIIINFISSTKQYKCSEKHRCKYRVET